VGGVGTSVKGAASDSNSTEYEIGGLGLDTTFDGTIDNNRSGTAGASITKVGSSTLTLSGTSTDTGDTTVSEGTLALVDLAALTATPPNIRIVSGATLDVSGLSAPPFYINFGQVLNGNGTVTGSIDTIGGGEIDPGESIGTLSVTGDAALWTTTIMEVNRNASPNADKLVASTIGLSGTIVITNTGFNLQVGDSFDLFDRVITDSFPVIQGPSGVTFDTSQLISDGIVTVAAVPMPPAITSVVVESGTNLVSAGTGGSAFGVYQVLSSFDVAAPVATWTAVQTNLFDFDGSFSFTNVIDPDLSTELFLIQGQ